ncbi:putative sulfate exporter family transporter [Myxococcota bacterium]|nr:putative sulfate exporter family transporter [Myxococcota bacterium]MBU1534023.1 putative sulfate exporter family transporter [Myxococcota bacterium]
MKKKLPGILCCTMIAGAAVALSPMVHLGAVTLALVLGIVVSNLWPLPRSTSEGIQFSEKHVLTWAIALLGFRMDYSILLSLGLFPLLLVFLGVVFTLGAALLMGRLFKIDLKLALLLGVGNAFCGTSAIAATQGVIKSEERHVAVSIAVINLLGTLGIFVVPFLAVALGLHSDGQGLLIGNTLQAVGQVTAAGFGLSEVAGQTGTVIKLGRILLLTPLILLLTFSQRKDRGNGSTGARPGVPPFIIAFILFSIVNSLGVLPHLAHAALTISGKIMLIVAMAAIGMKITLRGLAAKGLTALGTGAMIWLLQILFSVALILILA